MMTNSKYWRKRQEKEMKSTLKDVNKTVKKVKKHYNKAKKTIKNDISGLVGRYMEQTGITDVDFANKILNNKDLYEWRGEISDYLEWIDNARDVKTREALLLELNTLSMQSRITQKEAVEARIKASLAELATLEENLVGDYMKKEFSDNYYSMLYKLQKQGVIKAHLVDKLTNNEVTEHVRRNWKGGNFSRRIWNRQFKIADEITNTVSEQLATGKSIDHLKKDMIEKLTKKVDDTMDKSFNMNVERLIQTEVAHAKGQADLKAYRDEDIEKYEFIASIDEKTCDICGKLDGKVFNVKDAVAGENYPAMHPRCGCTTGVYDEVYDLAKHKGTRKASDNKEYDIPAGMTYEEWQEKYIKKSKNIEKELDIDDDKGYNEDSRNKHENKNSIIDKNYINSSQYRNKFNEIDDDLSTVRAISKSSKEMLNHRTGTDFEDLFLYDTKTKKGIINKSYDKIKTVAPNKSQKQLIKNAEPYTIVGVHNHPNSTVPSESDFIVAIKRKYKYGIVACHDGTIFKYNTRKVTYENFKAMELIHTMKLNSMEIKLYKGESISEELDWFFNNGIEIEVIR